QANSDLDVNTVCNTETGEYDITFDIVNNITEEADIAVIDFEVDGADQALTFSPNPVPPEDTSTATASVPGATTAIFLDLTVTWGETSDSHQHEATLDGDCEPDLTTTTSMTSTTMETTTTAP